MTRGSCLPAQPRINPGPEPWLCGRQQRQGRQWENLLQLSTSSGRSAHPTATSRGGRHSPSTTASSLPRKSFCSPSFRESNITCRRLQTARETCSWSTPSTAESRGAPSSARMAVVCRYKHNCLLETSGKLWLFPVPHQDGSLSRQGSHKLRPSR